MEGGGGGPRDARAVQPGPLQPGGPQARAQPPVLRGGADRLVIAYSPLAQGLLSGKYSPSNRHPSPIRLANPMFLPENLDRAAQLLRTLVAVAAVHEATSAQVALAWDPRRPNTVVIPGARTVEQLETNVAAADLDLTDAEDAVLTAAADASTRLGAMGRAQPPAQGRPTTSTGDQPKKMRLWVPCPSQRVRL